MKRYVMCVLLIAAAAWLVLSRDAVRSEVRTGQSPQMPPPGSPRTDMNLTVSCATSYDSTAKLYTYNYTVASSNQSGSAMKVFGIYPMKYQVSISAPTHWAGFDKWQGKLDAVVWRVYDHAGTHQTDSTSFYELPVSPYCVAPGQNLSGFVLVSRQPPGTVTWYAQAYDTMASVDADVTDGIIPNASSLFELNVSGTTTGPNILSPVAVEEVENSALGFAMGTTNPSAQEVRVWYTLPAADKITLAVYDVQGRRLAILDRGQRPPGRHVIDWSGRTETGARLASGTYFARLTSGTGQNRVVRFVLVK